LVADDTSVELRMKNYLRQHRILAWSIGVPVLVLLVEWWLGSVHVAAMALVAVVAMTIAVAWYRAVVISWMPAAKALLAGSPRRRVAACVVTHRPTYTVIGAGDTYLRVRFVNRGLRQVVAHSGEITLVGPDANGNAVVFVDGWPAPLPAKIAAATAQTAPEPIVDEPNRFLTQQARNLWLVFAGLLLLAAGFGYDAQQTVVIVGRAEINGTAYFNWFFAVMSVAMAFVPLGLALRQHWLSRLLAAGQWQRYPAALVSWKAESQRLKLHTSLPDDRSLKVVVWRASPELMANVYVTATLWVVGTPAPGKLCAVGVPGLPIVAAARFA
jgi:hypothetical protein